MLNTKMFFKEWIDWVTKCYPSFYTSFRDTETCAPFVGESVCAAGSRVSFRHEPPTFRREWGDDTWKRQTRLRREVAFVQELPSVAWRFVQCARNYVL